MYFWSNDRNNSVNTRHACILKFLKNDFAKWKFLLYYQHEESNNAGFLLLLCRHLQVLILVNCFSEISTMHHLFYEFVLAEKTIFFCRCRIISKIVHLLLLLLPLLLPS